MRAALAALAIATALSGCSPDEPQRPPARDGPTSPAPTDSRADAPADSVLVGDPPTAVAGPLAGPPATWTHRTTSVDGDVGVATLRAFRAAGHAGYDRVVFEMEGAIPGYHIEYVDRPAYACGSGEALYLSGDAWLLVRLRPARAHDAAGNATITRRRRTFGLPVLREAALTCDFEADVSWVLGLAAPGGYRVTELDGPPRLVIDVRS